MKRHTSIRRLPQLAGTGLVLVFAFVLAGTIVSLHEGRPLGRAGVLIAAPEAALVPHQGWAASAGPYAWVLRAAYIAPLVVPAELGAWPWWDPTAPAATAPEGLLPAVLSYRDPTGAAVPLTYVAGRGEEHLTPRIRLADFAARDGAPLARISEAFVYELDLLMALAGVPVYINSGYRHPAYNANPSVGGAALSRHLAGQAADIWSPEMEPLELAAVALEVMGCRIGLGLGRTFIHVDVRGYLATWALEDAVLEEDAFDAWVRARCTGDGSLLLASEDSTRKGLNADTTRTSSAQTPLAERVSPGDLVARYRDVMAGYARVQHRKGGRGAVVLDLRPPAGTSSTGGAQRDAALAYRLLYVPANSSEATALGLARLLRGADLDRYFVFAVIDAAGRRTTGVMGYDPPAHTPSPPSSAPQ